MMCICESSKCIIFLEISSAHKNKFVWERLQATREKNKIIIEFVLNSLANAND